MLVRSDLHEELLDMSAVSAQLPFLMWIGEDKGIGVAVKGICPSSLVVNGVLGLDLVKNELELPGLVYGFLIFSFLALDGIKFIEVDVLVNKHGLP